MFAASCIGVALLVVSLEFLRRLGTEYDRAILAQFQLHVAAQAADLKYQSGADSGHLERRPCVAFRATPLQQLIRAGIHAATFGVAYIVMLLAMYFNGYIIISIILGAFLGKFLCDWRSQKVPVEGMSPVFGAPVEQEPTMCCG
jgi:copper transporter 1